MIDNEDSGEKSYDGLKPTRPASARGPARGMHIGKEESRSCTSRTSSLLSGTYE